LSAEKKPSSCLTEVPGGMAGGHDGLPGSPSSPAVSSSTAPQRKKLSLDEYAAGVLSGDRVILGRAITLIESNAPAHQTEAQELIRRLMPHTGRSIRMGITGVPGAGKSTFIEALGNRLCDDGQKVAVLAVDPSSSRSRGSILGDKTRMEKLARRTEAFIRPSPTGGTLGGVARKSRETMLLCEAAGFDVVLVETVGVGQSEITVRSMVDFFLLVVITGAGDELQGIKRGVMELSDALLVHKADGDNRARAELARVELEQALHYLEPATPGWISRALCASSHTGEGIGDVWALVLEFIQTARESGAFDARRRGQVIEWVKTMVAEYLDRSFYRHQGVAGLWPEVERAVLEGALSPTQAVERLVDRYEERNSG
jgi:LAO/AO transport system kinase